MQTFTIIMFCHPLCVVANVYLGGGLSTYERGVDIIDPFLYMFGCKYNSTGEPVQY